MLSLQGLRAVYVTSRSSFPTEPVHGIIIGGGNDIEPEHYGEQKITDRSYDPERDIFEMSMIRRAMVDNIPMLGICRGAQLINVVFGGSLYPDIRGLRSLTSNQNHLHPVKWVALDAESRFRRHICHEKIKVNSLHRQAIDQVGNGLTVTGRDDDGFVQMVEGNFGFLLGVQWHPEYLPYKGDQRRLFQLFANAVRESGRTMLLSEPVAT